MEKKDLIIYFANISSSLLEYKEFVEKFDFDLYYKDYEILSKSCNIQLIKTLKIDRKTRKDILLNVISSRYYNFECFKFVVDNCFTKERFYFDEYKIIIEILEYDLLECLIYLENYKIVPAEKGIVFMPNGEKHYVLQTCAIAAYSGSINCLKYLIENGYEYDEDTIYAAAGGRDTIDPIKSLECLKYLHNIGCPWDSSITMNAVKYGRLENLKFLHEGVDIPCPWDDHSTAAAIRHGHLDCLKYLHENGCRWCNFHFHHTTFIKSKECIIYAMENGMPYNQEDYDTFIHTINNMS